MKILTKTKIRWLYHKKKQKLGWDVEKLEMEGVAVATWTLFILCRTDSKVRTLSDPFVHEIIFIVIQFLQLYLLSRD